MTTVLVLCLVALAGCESSDSSIRKELLDIMAGMDDAQRAHNERMRRELLKFMNLETMFPDESVKRLADAAGRGRIRRVEELVRSGVDVNSRGNKGATPLFWALRKENLEGFVRLLELGADPNLVMGSDPNVGMGADPNVVMDTSVTVMHKAAYLKDTRFLRAALTHGGDPNIPAGLFGETPLFDAVMSAGYGDNLDFEGSALQLLLDAGGDVNSTAKGTAGAQYRETPLIHAACSSNNFKILYELLARGADFGVRSNFRLIGPGFEKLRENEKYPDGIPLGDCIAWKLEYITPESAARPEVTRVIRWLEERGVEIPDPELFRPPPGKGIENILLEPAD